ncbi:hypothetical protein, partial [Mycobacterium kyogaense]|uniref:hypothetical protein n=1 Tax=Mycobacterium kyogaense TaxID=2212479 RepID=UPI0013C4E55B
FNILTKINFFKLYLKQKIFAQWLKNIRVKQFLSVRAKLAKKFFIAKQSYATPLRKFHRELASIQSASLVNLPHIREGLSLDRFTTAMTSQKMAAVEYYRTTMDGVEKQLGQLINTLQQRADVPDFGSHEALEQYITFLEDQAVKRSGG